jgi:hypothetical protein
VKAVVLFGLVCSIALALGCGGQVIMDREGRTGSGGEGGDGQGEGGAGSCTDIDCSNEGSSCSCTTSCMGPDLRAECQLKSGGEVVCECHYDGAYMGLCTDFSGTVCGLPGGCCYGYLPN